MNFNKCIVEICGTLDSFKDEKYNIFHQEARLITSKEAFYKHNRFSYMSKDQVRIREAIEHEPMIYALDIYDRGEDGYGCETRSYSTRVYTEATNEYDALNSLLLKKERRNRGSHGLIIKYENKTAKEVLLGL